MWETTVLQNCLYSVNNCMKAGHRGLFSRIVLVFYTRQALNKQTHTQKKILAEKAVEKKKKS